MIAHLQIVLLPLIIANCLHMAVVKRNLFPALQIPLSVTLFGENKTLRGFLLLPFMNAAILFGLSQLPGFPLQNDTVFIGLLLGSSYMLAELPNSFLKRRMGIAAGGSATNNPYFFTLLDKTDSALGVAFAYWLLSGISMGQALLLFLCCSFTHFAFSWLLVQVKLKKSF